jgi:Mechanosensitive ion channel, conserved TM helix
MDSPIPDLFYNFNQKIISYLPNLFAGLLLVGIGWLLGWFAKRVVIQLCVIFRPDRILQRFRWGKGFLKADVRHALFNFTGNIAFLIVFLIFLNNALSVMQVAILSKLLEMGIFFLPRLLSFLLILGVGWVVSWFAAGAIQEALLKEEVPRATLIARFSKTVLLLFFSAMALTELNIAREIVIIGFTTIIVTLGILAIVLVALGGKTLVKKVLDTFEEE